MAICPIFKPSNTDDHFPLLGLKKKKRHSEKAKEDRRQNAVSLSLKSMYISNDKYFHTPGIKGGKDKCF